MIKKVQLFPPSIEIVSHARELELEADAKRLRELVILLSDALLRNIAPKFPRDSIDADGVDLDGSYVELHLREAEESFRCSEIPGLGADIVKGLQDAGHAFMEKAMEIKTKIQNQ